MAKELSFLSLIFFQSLMSLVLAFMVWFLPSFTSSNHFKSVFPLCLQTLLLFDLSHCALLQFFLHWQFFIGMHFNFTQTLTYLIFNYLTISNFQLNHPNLWVLSFLQICFLFISYHTKTIIFPNLSLKAFAWITCMI